jgi:PAS domain S-box-containing protein
VKRYYIILFIVTSSLLALLAWQLYRHFEESSESFDWIVHSYEVMRSARMTITNLQELEIGKDSFLITANKDILTSYNKKIEEIHKNLSRLVHMTRDNEIQNGRARHIEMLVKNHEVRIQDFINRFKEGNIANITINDVRNHHLSIENINHAIDEFIAEELKLLNQRSEEDSRKRKKYYNVLLSSTLLALIGMLVANTLIFSMTSRNRKISARLEDSERRFLLAMKGLNDGVFEYHPHTDKIYYSPRFKEMLGYQNDEFPDTLEAFNSHLHPDDAEQCWEIANRFFKRETDIYQNIFRVRHKNGGYVWVLSRGLGEWDKKGQCIRLVGAHTDITAQKMREEYLENLNKDLENFTYIASHDLRSPLVNLKGFAGEISYTLQEIQEWIEANTHYLPPESRSKLESYLFTDIKESLAFIHTAVDKMDRLTTAIMDLSRIGRREFRREKIDIHALVCRCIEALAFEINEKKVKVEIGNLPDAESDPVALEQVFGNLIDNAVKYLDPERAGHISIKGKEYWNRIEYSVTDNGRGIDDIDKPKVFAMFRRGNNTIDTPGNGMGMAYVKATVQQLGGIITMESEKGKGSTFTFSLPKTLKTIH